MSKESYIGGEYIETTGGNSTTYGESILNIAGSQFVQNGGDGVFHGTNGEAPMITTTVALQKFMVHFRKPPLSGTPGITPSAIIYKNQYLP